MNDFLSKLKKEDNIKVKFVNFMKLGYIQAKEILIHISKEKEVSEKIKLPKRSESKSPLDETITQKEHENGVKFSKFGNFLTLGLIFTTCVIGSFYVARDLPTDISAGLLLMPIVMQFTYLKTKDILGDWLGYDFGVNLEKSKNEKIKEKTLNKINKIREENESKFKTPKF